MIYSNWPQEENNKRPIKKRNLEQRKSDYILLLRFIVISRLRIRMSNLFQSML